MLFFKKAQADSKESVAEGLPKALESLWRFAFRLSGNPQDAEELVQRTALRALEKQHLYQPDTRLISWLFSITHSIWKNELRSRQIRQHMSFDTAQPQQLPVHHDNVEQQMMLDSVIKAVYQLPEAQKIPMILVNIEGLSYQEAADILDIPIGTLMSRIARARVRIGEIMLSTETHNKEASHEI